MDLDANDVLSLAELVKGARDVLGIGVLFDARPAIMRAYQIARNSEPSSRGRAGDDSVELKEF